MSFLSAVVASKVVIVPMVFTRTTNTSVFPNKNVLARTTACCILTDKPEKKIVTHAHVWVVNSSAPKITVKVGTFLALYSFEFHSKR